MQNFNARKLVHMHAHTQTEKENAIYGVLEAAVLTLCKKLKDT
jgi:hypothetical protein